MDLASLGREKVRRRSSLRTLAVLNTRHRRDWPVGKNFPSDADILDGIRIGHPMAEQLLVEKYSRALMAVAQRNGLGRADAEEVVSDTLLAAIEKGREGSLGPNVGPWLARVTRNRAIDKFRREKTRVEHEATALKQLGTGGEFDKEDKVFPFKRLEVQRAMKKLSERDRRVLTYVAARVTDEELAEYENITVNNARQVRSRALKRLKRELERSKV